MREEVNDARRVDLIGGYFRFLVEVGERWRSKVGE